MDNTKNKQHNKRIGLFLITTVSLTLLIILISLFTWYFVSSRIEKTENRDLNSSHSVTPYSSMDQLPSTTNSVKFPLKTMHTELIKKKSDICEEMSEFYKEIITDAKIEEYCYRIKDRSFSNIVINDQLKSNLIVEIMLFVKYLFNFLNLD